MLCYNMHKYQIDFGKKRLEWIFMKKRIVSLFLAAVMALTFVPMTAIASNIKVTINGSQVQFDQPPVIKDGRTLVPLRAIFEAMGCTVL